MSYLSLSHGIILPGTLSCLRRAPSATAGATSQTVKTGSSKAPTTPRSTQPTTRVSEHLEMISWAAEMFMKHANANAGCVLRERR